jgi:hypothetical protein
MKKIIKLTESDLMRIVKRVINENIEPKKGDYISLFCANHKENNSITINKVEYYKYIENNSSDKLILQKPLGSYSDKVYSSADDRDTYTLNIELITGDVLKKSLKVTDNDTYMMTYNVGGDYYCSSKSKLSPEWEAFFKEKNITF